jgi:hypothetical protein
MQRHRNITHSVGCAGGRRSNGADGSGHVTGNDDVVATLPEHKQGVDSAHGAPAAAPDSLVEAAQQSLGAPLGIASSMGERGQQLAAGARGALSSGMAAVFHSADVLLVLAALRLAFLIPGKREWRCDGEPTLELDDTTAATGDRGKHLDDTTTAAITR